MDAGAFASRAARERASRENDAHHDGGRRRRRPPGDGAHISALLTVTVRAIKTTIDAISAAGLRDSVKIIIGGARVTGEYAKQIGTDGYSANANAAVTVATPMIGLEAA